MIEESVLTYALLLISIVIVFAVSYRRTANIVRGILLLPVCVAGHFFIVNCILPLAITTNLTMAELGMRSPPPEALSGGMFLLPYNYFKHLGTELSFFQFNYRIMVYLITALICGIIFTLLFQSLQKWKGIVILVLSVVVGVWLIDVFLNEILYHAVWHYIDINLILFFPAGYLMGYGLGKLLIYANPKLYEKVSFSKRTLLGKNYYGSIEDEI